MNNSLLAATIYILREVDNLTLAAANNALAGFGYIHPQNKSHEKLLELNLINENGKPRDSETLLDALSYIINQRVRAGTFE